jgi:outer membrane protein TolC
MLDVVRLVAQHDTKVQRAELAQTQAQATRSLAYGTLHPQISVASTGSYPLYVWNRTTPPALPGSEATAVDTHRVGAELRVDQVLPTDGSVSLGLGNVMTITKRAEETEGEDVVDPSVAQSLALTATLRQPLFTNGRPIDLRIFGLARRLQADIPVDKARLAALADTNTQVVDALGTYVEIVYLRGSIGNLSSNVAHSTRRLEQAQVRVRQGSMTQRDLWDAELELDKLNDALLEARFALLRAEQGLAWSLGVEDLGESLLADTLPAVGRTYTQEEVDARLLSSSPEVRRLALAVEEATILETLHGREHAATLTASFSLSPQYAGDRDTSGDLGASYSDLFAESATWNTTLALGLSVPVYQGKKAAHQREQDRATIRIAQSSLQDVEQSLRQSVRLLHLERQLLEERLRSRESSLALERGRQGDKQRLLELERITQLDLEEGQAVVAGKALEVWYARAKLFLNALRILSLAGEDIPAVLQG